MTSRPPKLIGRTGRLVAAVVGALVLVAGGALTLGRIDLLGGIAFHASASPAPALDTPLLPVTPYAAVPLPAAVAAALGPALADLALGMLTG